MHLPAFSLDQIHKKDLWTVPLRPASLPGNKKLLHLTTLHSTSSLDLTDLGKLLTLAPNLQVLSLGPRDSSPSLAQPSFNIKPGQFLEMIEQR